jgi:hypothetical protein
LQIRAGIQSGYRHLALWTAPDSGLGLAVY